jgi:hypothetical protein
VAVGTGLDGASCGIEAKAPMGELGKGGVYREQWKAHIGVWSGKEGIENWSFASTQHTHEPDAAIEAQYERGVPEFTC